VFVVPLLIGSCVVCIYRFYLEILCVVYDLVKKCNNGKTKLKDKERCREMRGKREKRNR
jgi:hypothetical protein